MKLHSKKDEFLPTEDVALANMANVCYTMLADSSGTCYYGEMMGVHTYKLIEYLNAAGGVQLSGDEYMEIGKRVQTLRQLFNVKQGIDLTKVRLPKRMLGYPPISNGPLKGVSVPNAEEQIKMHWLAFGWDGETGVPTQQTLETLRIPELLEMEAL